MTTRRRFIGVRSFGVPGDDGALFYPDSRTFFDGFGGPYIGDTASGSNVPPIWNPSSSAT